MIKNLHIGQFIFELKYNKNKTQCYDIHMETEKNYICRCIGELKFCDDYTRLEKYDFTLPLDNKDFNRGVHLIEKELLD